MARRGGGGWAMGAVVIAMPVQALAANPSAFSVADNVSYAVSAICAPYALDGEPLSTLPVSEGLVQRDGYDGLARPNATGVRVGIPGFVHVTFSAAQDGARGCEVEARNADPQVLRRVALDALAKRPERFTPAKSRYLPGPFATEDRLCTAADSSHPNGFVTLSSPRPDMQRRVAILLTIDNPGSRQAMCDHEGVRMNYRTLVP